MHQLDFLYNEDKTKVQCRVCATGVPVERRVWMAPRSAARHLGSEDHKKALGLLEDAKRKREELEKERLAASAAEDLRNLHFAAAPNVRGPIGGVSSSHKPSLAETEMWENYALNGADFDAGDDTEDPHVRHEQLGLGDEDVAAQILEEDEEEDFLAEIMRNAGLEEPEPNNINGQKQNSTFAGPFGSKWFLYPSRMVNWSSLVVVSNDWANPTARKLIHVYPEILDDGIIREIWHAQKWCKSMDLDVLSPMYDAGISHYYVNEVSRLKNGDFIVPVRWVKFRGNVYCDAFSLTFNSENEATIIDDKTSIICVNDFNANYLNLQHAGAIPKWSASTIKAGYPSRMPNPKREIAGGDPIYTSFVDYFGDDVSGNRTKSWNKHWNAYFTHRNLPQKLLQQEFHVHFVSTSPNASVSEQFREFKAAVESTHTDPVRVQDETGNTTCYCLHMNAGPSDNPMQSEVTGHIGGKGNHFCRKCEVGGTQKEKATNDGYHALFEAGTPRTKEQIIDKLQKQVKLACSGVMSHVKDLQTQTGVKDVYTQYWIDNLISRFKQLKQGEPDRSDEDIQAELVQWTLDNQEKIYSAFLTMKANTVVGFHPTKDTPIEILHTILLGIVKYIWHISHTRWTPEQKQKYAVRLQATETDGLSIHAIQANYIMQYAGSLIGRQLKMIAQTNVFHVHDIVSVDKFLSWKATGELAALLWFPEIRNLAEYWHDLRVAIANVLDIFAVIDPSKIITKIKYHLLAHIDDDALEFGPLVGVATEIYECFNAIFRYCSILSNHLAPSRDIAIQLGDQEGLKHRLTGGWWSCGEDVHWQHAGPGVQHFLQAHPVLQRLLGWSEGKLLKSGAIKLVTLKQGQKDRVQYALQATTAARALNFGLYSADSMWKQCTSVVSESLDECLVGSWVFAKSDMPEGSTKSGRVAEILVKDTGEAIVILELFQNLMFKFNVQHDCHTAKCDATGERPRMQERVKSNNTEKYIVHNPLDRFIINSHSFHNAHLLCATLPRDLLAPVPLFEDRKSKHDEMAAELRSKRDSQLAKRKQKTTESETDEEKSTGPSKWRKRAKPTQRRQVVDQLAVVPDGLVAGRPKRVGTQTARAIALEDEDPDSDESEIYSNSGDDYSN
ncbi:hypothetical protein B0H10DRAFT_2191282 [Mycena sp. CBHHK59/15]|nr:hypothetical protein B0H10DRAFT_2191282 [Mycena sp. CBHHK59/15]